MITSFLRTVVGSDFLLASIGICALKLLVHSHVSKRCNILGYLLNSMVLRMRCLYPFTDTCLLYCEKTFLIRLWRISLLCISQRFNSLDEVEVIESLQYTNRKGTLTSSPKIVIQKWSVKE